MLSDARMAVPLLSDGMMYVACLFYGNQKIRKYEESVIYAYTANPAFGNITEKCHGC